MQGKNDRLGRADAGTGGQTEKGRCRDGRANWTGQMQGRKGRLERADERDGRADWKGQMQGTEEPDGEGQMREMEEQTGKGRCRDGRADLKGQMQGKNGLGLADAGTEGQTETGRCRDGRVEWDGQTQGRKGGVERADAGTGITDRDERTKGRTEARMYKASDGMQVNRGRASWDKYRR